MPIANYKKSLLPLVFLLAWLLAMGSSLYHLLGPEGERSDLKAGSTIAQVDQSDGEVISRSEDAMIWSPAANGHKLAQGSHLATGDTGQVNVHFRDGRRLRLEAHTQIIISEESKNGESTLVVSLVSGSLSALPTLPPPKVAGGGGARKPGKPIAAPEPIPLVIKAAGKATTLTAATDHLKISKGEGKAPAVLSEVSAGVKTVVDTTPVFVAPPKLVPKPVRQVVENKIGDRLERSIDDKIEVKTELETTVTADVKPSPVLSETLPDAALPSPAVEGDGAPIASKTLAQPAEEPVDDPLYVGAVASAPPKPASGPAPAVVKAAPAKPLVATPAAVAPLREVASEPPPVIQKTPRERAAPPAPLTAEGFEPTLAGLSASQIHWTEASMRGSEGTFYPIRVVPPRELPPGVTWRPVLRAEIMGGQAITVVGVSGGRQTLRLPLRQIKSTTLAFVSVRLQVGAILEQGTSKQKATSLVDGPVVTFASLTDVARAGPIDVHLALGESTAPSSSGWWVKAAADSEAPVTLHLASGQDIKRLLPLLRAARSLGVTFGGSKAASGWSYVRGDRIVATATGAALRVPRPALARVLAETFEAALAFLGPPAAFLTRPVASAAYLQRLSGAAFGKQQVFIYDRRPGDSSYAMHALTLTANSDIALYVGQGADGIFNQPVDLLPLTAH